MRIEQRQWTERDGWRPARSTPGEPGDGFSPQLVIAFGARGQLARPEAAAWLRETYPAAEILGCSTAGEICGTSVSDDTIVATAMEFEHTAVRTVFGRLEQASDSAAVGEALSRELASDDLRHVFVLAEGVNVNGSDLASGLRRGLPEAVAVTGGLAGDADRFEQTLVCYNGDHLSGAVVAVGFYGDAFRVGYGSLGGWDPFGPDRLVTRAEGNVLYELDESSALALYKRYLGPHAAHLPASGLLFPLSIRGRDGEPRVVRTILGIDEEQGSLIFAGDVPQGSYVRLMKANVDRLIDGAHGAAQGCYETLGSRAPDLAILISCVGRKLVLKQRTEEEVESVREVLGPDAVLSGFYSYGEIAPFVSSTKCELHNQTMTITTFAER